MGQNQRHQGHSGNNKGQQPMGNEPFVPARVVGVLTYHQGKLKIKSLRTGRQESDGDEYFNVVFKTLGNAKEGDIVVAKCTYDAANNKKANYNIKRILGDENTPKIFSLISLYERGLSEEFSQAVKDETKNMTVPDLQGREDLRNIPLVTIDGADARDFDDAVYAEPTADGGHHLIVAIADVAHYVRPGTALDQEALKRGNSTYLADMVVPMLPEALSNGLCSLKPNEDRACMAFHLYIDKDGNLTSSRIARGLMRSAARLTYEQVQKAKDGNTDATTAKLMDKVINPLYEAYAVLRAARDRRGTMDLVVPEYKAGVDQNGKINDVYVAKRYESMKVIEEFMILTNVAAAQTLESKNAICVYRDHALPFGAFHTSEVRNYLRRLGIDLPAEIKTAADYNDALEKARQMGKEELVSQAILSMQQKAIYSTFNIGHFGLSLDSYAHTTSPIRRYPDIIVHRSLIDVFNMGADGLGGKSSDEIEKMAQQSTKTEINSTGAENAARNRHRVAYLSGHKGEKFQGTIVGFGQNGIGVKLKGSGTFGVIPKSALPQDNYTYSEKDHRMVGQHHGRVYRDGASIEVIITNTDALSAKVTFKPANDNSADKVGPQFRASAQERKRKKEQQQQRPTAHKPR